MSPEIQPLDETDVRVALARMEGKLDVALATHAGRLDNHGEKIAANERELADQDKRIRALEILPTVSPKQLGAAVLGVIAALGAVAPFLDQLYS